MEHMDDIKRLIEVLLASSRFHLLIVTGAPGWAKTGTVSQALRDSNVSFSSIGSYATPVALFNHLAENPDGVLLLDDTAGVFSNTQTLAMLCAASWSSGESADKRRVRRSSTSDRAAAEFVDFSGKLIVITNNLPKSPLTDALMSRALLYQVEIAPEEISERILVAAASLHHFPDQDTVHEVVDFLTDCRANIDLAKINLRTLEQGYELACVAPQRWRDLFTKVLPKKAETRNTYSELIAGLMEGGKTVEEQASHFCQTTGKSRRTFFYLRKKREEQAMTVKCF